MRQLVYQESRGIRRKVLVRISLSSHVGRMVTTLGDNRGKRGEVGYMT